MMTDNIAVTNEVVESAMYLGFLLKVSAFLCVAMALNIANYLGLRFMGASKHNLIEVINGDSKAAAFYHGIRYFSFALVAAFIFG